MRLRDYLINLRSTHKLSQQDVADMVGISRQYYNAIENGNRQKKMDITLLTKLSEAFDVTLTQIFEKEQLWQKANL